MLDLGPAWSQLSPMKTLRLIWYSFLELFSYTAYFIHYEDPVYPDEDGTPPYHFSTVIMAASKESAIAHFERLYPTKRIVYVE